MLDPDPEPEPDFLSRDLVDGVAVFALVLEEAADGAGALFPVGAPPTCPASAESSE